MSEIMKLEKPVTIVTDNAITMAGSNLTVTANEEQIPKTKTVTGFDLKIGFLYISLFILIAFYLTSAVSVA